MDKRVLVLAFLVAAFTFSSITKADITSLVSSNDGDGAIACDGYWNSVSTTLTIDGPQYWAPGHMLASIDTDSATDPTLTIRTTVDNDTGFDWTSYHVNVYMNTNFTLSAATVYTPPSWTASITQQPIWNGTEYEGQLDYVGGAVVTNGTLSGLDFSYKVTFVGLTHYSFTQEMIPLPEPSAFGLIGMSVLMLGGITLGSRRRLPRTK